MVVGVVGTVIDVGEGVPGRLGVLVVMEASGFIAVVVPRAGLFVTADCVTGVLGMAVVLGADET